MTPPSQPAAPDARPVVVRLVCLPYAGGGSAVFYRWRPIMPPGAQLLPVCLPGRDARMAEVLAPDLKAVAGQVADEIGPQLDRPFVLLGHSMGALLAYELAQELRRRDARPPDLLVVAASGAPHAPCSTEPLHPLPDDEFLERLEQRFDGIPLAVRGNPELLALLLPMLRADVRLVETYQCERQPPLDVEILALGGTDDPSVAAGELAGWRTHTTRKFSARLLPGGHFFLFRSNGPAAISPALRLVADRLAALAGAHT